MGTRERGDALLALLAAAFGFTVRYLDHRDFANEQFLTLSQAQAWLAGNWPVRDYTQYGSILTDAISAAAQRLFGPSPFAELVLCTGALAMAAAVTFWVTTRITGRRSLGVCAALLQIWAGPVLFSYPKLLIYPVLLAFGLAYVRRQTRLRLLLLAAWAATAFLIRQDHGIYAFIAGFVLVVSVHHSAEGRIGIQTVQRAGVFVLAFLLLLTPFILYVQTEMGLQSYFRLGIEVSRLEAQRSAASMPMFRTESGPLFVLKSPQERDVIHIRWSPEVTDETRSAFEQRGHLRAGQAMEGRTWAYRVDRHALDALGTILNEPAVEVVDGIDRNTLRMPDESPAQRFLRVTQLDRLQLGPPIQSILSEKNCGTFLFYLCYLLPACAFVLWLTAEPERTELHETRLLLPALCVLALVCTAGFVRLETRRLPDVFGTFPILLCWSISTLQTFGKTRRPVASRAMTFVLLGAVAVCVYRIGGDYSPLLQEAALHPLNAFARAKETTRSTREWPWSAQRPEDEEWKLAVYVHDCTREDDRLFVAWRAPEFFYFSRRVFAGREGAFLEPITIASLSLRFPDMYEQKVLDAWQQQSVPIVLTSDSDQSDVEFATLFPALEHHLETAYVTAGTTRWRGRPSITVHVDKNRTPFRKDPQFGLPCFTKDAAQID